jgi:hypothetical protein
MKFFSSSVRLPWLPDFLADHTLLAVDATGRLREVIGRWNHFVRGLWFENKSTAYVLSFSSVPGSRSVDVAFSAESADEQELQRACERLCHQLANQRIPFNVASASQQSYRFAVGMRQRQETFWKPPKLDVATGYEHITQMFFSKFDRKRHGIAAPVWLPWRGGVGAFHMPFRILTTLNTPARIEILLRPIVATSFEREFLAGGAMVASGGVNFSSNRPSPVGPIAELAQRLYYGHLKRLFTSFLVEVRLLADSETDAYRLSSAIEGVVSETPISEADADLDGCPTGVDVYSSSPVQRYQDCWFQESQSLDRLPYLTDAEGAVTVFRLPVSVQGGIPGVVTRQMSPDFDPGPDEGTHGGDRLILGVLEGGGRVTMPVSDLTKHSLVTGFTGSGKTVTIQYLLHQLWCDFRKPFLIIESSKQEYRGLFGVAVLGQILRVYTLGNENGVPFRLNPFQLIPGVRVESHIGQLQVCFEAAIAPVGPSSSVIAEALVRVYERFGWRLNDVSVAPSVSKGASRLFPTMTDFAAEVGKVIERRSYSQEITSNLKAAILGRLTPLSLGSKGKMLDCQTAEPGFEKLLSLPTVLELNDLNIDDKALMTMFLLVFLREFREQQAARSPVRGLVHLTVVEEAHNVLAETVSAGRAEGAAADTRFKAVEAFCQLLTEVRALGEGLVIVDQSPEKLAQDAIRNTNLQVAHQLRDSADRDAIARAMTMTREQTDYLGKLRVGCAALFKTGLERATFVQIPTYHESAAVGSHPELVALSNRGDGFIRPCSIEEVRSRMGLDRDVSWRPFPGCGQCEEQSCLHRDMVFGRLAPLFHAEDSDDLSSNSELSAIRAELIPLVRDFRNLSIEMKSKIEPLCMIASQQSDRHGSGSFGEKWCFVVHLWRWLVSRGVLVRGSVNPPHEMKPLLETTVRVP